MNKLDLLIQNILNENKDEAAKNIHDVVLHKVRKYLNENWDTDELGRWVLNDEGLYNVGLETNNWKELRDVVSEFFPFSEYDINPDKVDWSEIYADLHDEDEDEGLKESPRADWGDWDDAGEKYTPSDYVPPKKKHMPLKGWHIQRNKKPIPNRNHDWDFWHDDYDGADGGNGLAGTASSYDDAVSQIIEINSTRETR